MPLAQPRVLLKLQAIPASLPIRTLAHCAPKTLSLGSSRLEQLSRQSSMLPYTEQLEESKDSQSVDTWPSPLVWATWVSGVVFLSASSHSLRVSSFQTRYFEAISVE